MAAKAPIFDKILKDYCSEVASIDFSSKSDFLGIRVTGKTIEIPFFSDTFTITSQGVSDAQGKAPHHAVSVILCKYLLLCPEAVTSTRELVTYKDFRDAAPLIGSFRANVEKPICSHFSGKIEALETQCRKLGGHMADIGVSSQLSYGFNALPQIPVYLLFNDRDEEFPADATILFERKTGDFLDMECVAMIGMWLGAKLTNPYFSHEDLQKRN